MREPLLVAGTRPELIKMAPVIFALKRLRVPFKFLRSGQHHDYGLSQSFIDQSELPQPDCARTQIRRLVEEMIALGYRSQPAPSPSKPVPAVLTYGA